MKPVFWLVFLTFILNACIGDDVVFDTIPENLRITNSAETLAVGDAYQFESRFTNNIGETEERDINWRSTNLSVLSISLAGLAMGVSQGEAMVIAEIILNDGRSVSDSALVVVSDTTTVSNNSDQRNGKIKTTSSYLLTGNFSLKEIGDKLILSFESDYEASSSLPGLYLYLTNNPATNNNAFEVSKVDVFKGEHSYEISGVELNQYDYLLYYCKPFSVKVGDGEISK